MMIRASAAALAVALTPLIAQAQGADVGQQLYMSHCAVCHGVDGEGAGSFAEFLNVAPPTLTDLAAKNDGEFPMLQIIHVIDGRSGTRGHGSEMPVWGDRFMINMTDPTDTYYDTIRVRGLVLSLAQYLESIQK